MNRLIMIQTSVEEDFRVEMSLLWREPDNIYGIFLNDLLFKYRVGPMYPA